MGLGTSYRLNRNLNGGGLMLFVREDIPSNLVEAETKPIEDFYIELNLRNYNWLLIPTKIILEITSRL